MNIMNAQVLSRDSIATILLVKRWAAFVIDHVLLALIWVVGFFILKNPIHWIYFVIYFAYFTVLESLYGKTLGKKVLGIEVVGVDCYRIGLFASLFRTLIRIIDVNPFLLGGLPATLMILLTSDRQRLGDLIAGSYVLESGKLDQAWDQSYDKSIVENE